MSESTEDIDTRPVRLGLKSGSIEGYDLLDENSETVCDPYAIGFGGSGIVYKAKQRLYKTSFALRAIKFFMYEDSILANDENKEPISEDDFISEIGNVTTFNHQSLIRVVGAGFHVCDAGSIPYIITDFIDGTTLKKVLDPVENLDLEIQAKFLNEPDLVLDFLLDIAYAIKHIHDRKFAHCDIAPKNIFIYRDCENIKPVLGDLGISKPITKSGKSKTRIIGSRRWMPKSAMAYYDKEVEYHIFSSLQPYWDVYSFSKTGLKLLEIFQDERPRSWFSSLKKDFEKACDESNKWNIDVLIERLEFLKPIHREVAKVQELSMGVGSGRRKMMPVEALTTTKRLHDLIRHPALLRLSFVPQLTTANQILPGANHTRYEHTLGVIETMRRYLLSLLDEPEFLEHLSAKKIEVGLLVAALSCATRFPLSNVIHEIRDKDKGLFSDFSRHSLYLEVLRIKDSKGIALKDLIRDKFSNVGVSNLVSILCAEKSKFDDADSLIYSLINNSIDVRVIDFVRRDSHHLGIISGDSFQIDEILPHVTIFEHKLALKIEGVSIAEQIILLRYWLFSRVYWNQPNRIFCAMARLIFLELHKHEDFVSELRLNVFNLDQRGMIEFLIEQCEKFGLQKYRDIAVRLSGAEHSLYRVIYETNRVDVGLEEEFDKLQRLSIVDIDSLAQSIEGALANSGFIGDGLNIIPVIVDYPIEPGNKKMGGDLNILFGKKSVKNILDVSGIIKGASESFENQLSKFRVFLHPDLDIKKEDMARVRDAVRDSSISFLRTVKS